MNKVDYLLVCLMEEAAEVQQLCAKSLRFGLEDVRPDTATRNVDELWKEINDMYAILDMLKEQHVDLARDEIKINTKKQKVQHYMQYSKQAGKLDE